MAGPRKGFADSAIPRRPQGCARATTVSLCEALYEIASSHCLLQGSRLRRLSLMRLQQGFPTRGMGPTDILHGDNHQDRMSALGQKRTSEHVRVMSALPPKADMDQHGRNVRLVPKADIDKLNCH